MIHVSNLDNLYERINEKELDELMNELTFSFLLMNEWNSLYVMIVVINELIVLMNQIVN